MILAELKRQPEFNEPVVARPDLPQSSRRASINKRRASVNKAGLMVNLTVFILAFCAVGVALYVHSALLGYQMVALKQDIAHLENENSKIGYNIAQLSSLERVQAEAEKKLGMFRPQADNMVALAAEPESNVSLPQAGDQTAAQPRTAALKKDYQVISSILDRFGLPASF